MPDYQTVVTITFEERGGKTLLTFHQGVFEKVEERDSHQWGWGGSLDKLAEVLATL
jgi:uncharacterized protein YndB with AHSA1/START domain